MKKLNKKEYYNVEWKRFPIEDKILFIMEMLCYFFTIGTLILIILSISNGFFRSTLVLSVATIGLYGCGRNARSSRDFYMNKFKLKINKRIENSKEILTIN